jgi:tRNA threonylcarbamoyladenosine biosynthesis protein TsaE
MKQNELEFSYTLETIEQAALRLWQYGHQQSIWAFRGEMGAGKTTLIHTLCKQLGVQDTVSSPTYALINEYQFKNDAGMQSRILHMDWYRLSDTAEAIEAGMEDALSSGHYCFVEWPQRAAEILPSTYLQVSITAVSDTERRLNACLQFL